MDRSELLWSSTLGQMSVVAVTPSDLDLHLTCAETAKELSLE